MIIRLRGAILFEESGPGAVLRYSRESGVVEANGNVEAAAVLGLAIDEMACMVRLDSCSSRGPGKGSRSTTGR